MGMIGDKGALKDVWNHIDVKVNLKVKLINNLQGVLDYYGFNGYKIIFEYSKNASSLYIGYKYNLYNRVELKF